MKAGKVLTMKAVALGVAVMFIAASCGGSDSASGGKTKNSALCFATQADKDAAIATAQAELDAANATTTSGASGGYRRPAVRSMSGDTTVPPESTVPAVAASVDTTVPAPTVLDSGANIPMLEQALLDAQNQPLCDATSDTTATNASAGGAVSYQVDETCHAPDSQSIVDAAVSGDRSTLSIEASNFIFGNPCGETVKHLSITLALRDSATDTVYNFSQTVSEWSIWDFVSPVGSTIDSVVFASYGTPVEIPSSDNTNNGGPAETSLVWSEWGTIKDVLPVVSFSLAIPDGGGIIEIRTHTKTPNEYIGETSAECGDNLADSWIIITDMNNSLIAQDDDSGMGMEPCSFWASYLYSRVEAGNYNILATNYGAFNGFYWEWDMAYDLDYRFGAQVAGVATVDTVPAADTTIAAADTTVPAAGSSVPAADTTVPAAGSTVPAAVDTTVAPSSVPPATDPAQVPVVTVPLPVVVQLPVNPPMPIIETVEAATLPVADLISQTPVAVPNISTMICDAECITAMFVAANLDSGTLTINGVQASYGAPRLKVPVQGKQGTITAVVASTDGKSVLEVSSKFDRAVEYPAASSSMDSADGSTAATSGSSKSIYIYVLIALLILVAVGYMRRKKATEAK